MLKALKNLPSQFVWSCCRLFFFLKRNLFHLSLIAQACNVIKKETLVQVFSWEFWEIFKNTFLTKHLLQILPAESVQI